MSKISSVQRNGWPKTLIICVTILLVGLLTTFIIFNTEPVAEREGAVKRSAMLVSVTNVEQGTFRPLITALGTVVPAKDIMLSPLVGGEVIELMPGFTPGGYVKQGDVLLRIDPVDYEHDLAQARSALAQAEADLVMEKGRRNVAQKEYDMLQESLEDEMRELVLREPQLQQAEAQVQAAQAAVKQAELALSRTTIKAPFDAHVLSRTVNIGSQVSAGSPLGRLVGLNTYWIEATVPLTKIHWLTFENEHDKEGAMVQVRSRTAWPEELYREGRLFKMIGELEGQTRMARILITVDDPLALQTDDMNIRPLVLGAFMEAKIQARAIKDVVRLHQDYLRNNDTVWVMDDGKLSIREVTIVFRDRDYVYISEGLEADARVVTTNLSTVVEGVPLRLKEQSTEEDTSD